MTTSQINFTGRRVAFGPRPPDAGNEHPIGCSLLDSARRVAADRNLRIPLASELWLPTVAFIPQMDCALSFYSSKHECTPVLHVGVNHTLAWACKRHQGYNTWRKHSGVLFYEVFKRPSVEASNVLTDQENDRLYQASVDLLLQWKETAYLGPRTLVVQPQEQTGTAARSFDWINASPTRASRELDEPLVPSRVDNTGRAVNEEVQPSARQPEQQRAGEASLDPQQQASRKEMQLRRATEFTNYVAAEYEHLEGKCLRAWNEIFHGTRDRADVTAAWQESDGLAVLQAVNHRFGAMFFKGIHTGQKYDMGFDGEKLIPVSYDVRDDTYSARTTATTMLVMDDLRLVQPPRFRESFQQINFQGHDAKVDLVSGVPGAGKTEEIIRRARRRDLILTVNRETRSEINVRLRGHHKGFIQCCTVDSLIINRVRWRHHYRVFVDEGLLTHPGVLDIIGQITQPQEILVFGDPLQLNFINRVPGFQMEHTRYPFDHVEVRAHSYRCPKDVARIFSPEYTQGMTTSNPVEVSLYGHATPTLQHIQQLNLSPGTKYITWTQKDKAILLQNHLDANTIHEVQGKTYDHVCLVRMTTESIRLFESEPHTLVAMTRHKQSFHYCTAAPLNANDDLVVRILNCHYPASQ